MPKKTKSIKDQFIIEPSGYTLAQIKSLQAYIKPSGYLSFGSIEYSAEDILYIADNLLPMLKKQQQDNKNMTATIIKPIAQLITTLEHIINENQNLLKNDSHEFKREIEFPSYFKIIAEALQDAGASVPRSKEKIIKLIEKNFDVILSRLQIPYAPDPDTNHIETNRFFQALQATVQKEVTDWNVANNPEKPPVLRLYIGGGVVRSLLAYIYNELQTQLQEQQPNIESNEILKKLSLETGHGSLAEFISSLNNFLLANDFNLLAQPLRFLPNRSA